MAQEPISALNRRSGEIVKRVEQDGEVIELTRHGKVVAKLVPADEDWEPPVHHERPADPEGPDVATVSDQQGKSIMKIAPSRSPATSTAQQTQPKYGSLMSTGSSSYFQPVPKPGKPKDKKR